MIDKLITKIKKTGAPIVVGLDPMLNYIPEQNSERLWKGLQRQSGSIIKES